MDAAQTGNNRIVVSREDLPRLETLVLGAVGREMEAADHLDLELGRAQVVDAKEVPRDVVTMRSKVRYADENGTEKTITLVYPNEARPSEGLISVLAPVGAALLGLKEGQSIDSPMPGKRSRRLRVLEVVWQPQAAEGSSAQP